MSDTMKIQQQPSKERGENMYAVVAAGTEFGTHETYAAAHMEVQEILMELGEIGYIVGDLVTNGHVAITAHRGDEKVSVEIIPV